MAVARALTLGRLHVPQTLGAVFISKRDQSSLIFDKHRRGRGGRSSFSGIVATVFGCSGCVGRYVINELGKMGSQVIVAYRGEPYHIQFLKMAGDLGQILFSPFHLRDEESLRKCMQYSNVVINLIGRDYPTKNFTLDDVHVDGARRVARIAKECGVERLIHFSSLNASLTPQPILGKEGPPFLVSKFKGEQAVREEFPEATIIRPADVIGQEDRFARQFTDYKRRTKRNIIHLWKKGEQTVKRPVIVEDVAKGTVNAALNPDAIGKTYEFYGPNAYYFSDLVDYMAEVMLLHNPQRRNISPYFRMKAKVVSYFPERIKYDLSKVEKDCVTDRPTECPGLVDLGVEPEDILETLRFIVKPYGKTGYYTDFKGGNMNVIPKPKPVTFEY